MLKNLLIFIKTLGRFFTNVFNFILVFFIYWFGVSISFLLWKAKSLFRKEKRKTYWINYKNHTETHERQV